MIIPSSPDMRCIKEGLGGGGIFGVEAVEMESSFLIYTRGGGDHTVGPWVYVCHKFPVVHARWCWWFVEHGG